MTTAEALNILDQAAQRAPMMRNDHALVIEALQTLKAATTAPAPAPDAKS